jgi:Alpha 1,4-glycosyltransferase conserved region/Glycosyltransferase sugar-binding region containing DXD motif
MGNERVITPPYASCHISYGNFLRDANEYWFHIYHPESGDVIVDIGGGRSKDIFAFSRAVGRQGRVFAVETDPVSCELLKQFCARNSLVNVTVSTSVDPELDELRSRLGIASIDFLKMNLKGAKRIALSGCAETLDHTRYVCIAAHDRGAEHGDGEECHSLHFVIDYLRNAGFDTTVRANDLRPYVRDHVHGRNRRYAMAGARGEQDPAAFQSREVIQGLWIGPRLSAMERLCISSFQNHGHPFHLYVYQETEGIPPGTVVHDANKILPASAIFTYRDHATYAGFANFFRYKLLLEKGGWFVDLDTVCMKPFQFNADYVFSTEGWKGEVDVNVAAIRVPPDSDIMRWAWEACQAMDPRELTWAQAGPILITRAVEHFALQPYVLPPETFCPVPYREWDRVLEPISLGESSIQPYAIHLWNEMWRRAGRDKDGRYDDRCVYEQLKQQYLSQQPSNSSISNSTVAQDRADSATSRVLSSPQSSV